MSLEVHHSVLGQTWRARDVDEDQVRLMSQRLRVPEIVARVMAGRGVSDATADAFLDTSLRTHLPDPSTVIDLDKGVARLADAVEAGEGIGIFGDYDVDGGTGTATLTRYLRAIGANVITHIPDRRTEGYGPSMHGFRTLAEKGARVIVTVDCGTAGGEALHWAAGEGLPVIVVDHHLPTEQLPPALAIINPQRAEDSSGLSDLSAAGMAFVTTVGLNRALRGRGYFESKGMKEPDLLPLLDLTSLGTVCDVVALKGLNRAFVAQGLKVLAARGNEGLTALSDVSKLNGALTTYHLGFMLGPRLNAGGRLGPPGLALDLLTTSDPVKAQRIARELDSLNAQRRDVEREVQRQAEALADEQVSRGAKVVVVAGENWHEGVVGIVAGRLKDRCGVPAIVLSIDEHGMAKGSGRSLKGVDLGGAVVAAAGAGLLLKGGGHEMAAGMSLPETRIDEFQSYLSVRLGDAVDTAVAARALEVDGLVSLAAMTTDLTDAFGLAAPYGAGNPEPLIVAPRVTVAMADIVGGDHVRCILGDEAGSRVKGIAFRAAHNGLGEALLSGERRPLALAGRIKEDNWQGRRQVQLEIVDAALQ